VDSASNLFPLCYQLLRLSEMQKVLSGNSEYHHVNITLYFMSPPSPWIFIGSCAFHTDTRSSFLGFQRIIFGLLKICLPTNTLMKKKCSILSHFYRFGVRHHIPPQLTFIIHSYLTLGNIRLYYEHFNEASACSMTLSTVPLLQSIRATMSNHSSCISKIALLYER